MGNLNEKAPERIPTKDEVMKVISRFAESSVIERELSDEQGLYLLETKIEGKEAGEHTLYVYMRKGIFPDHNESLATGIHVVYYQNDIPVGGEGLAVYKEETGEWEEEK